MQDLTEAYLSVYDDINEVKGFGGHVDPKTGKSTGMRSPSQQSHTDYWRKRNQGETPDPRRSKFKYGGSTKPTTGSHAGETPEGFAKKQNPDLAMTPAKRMETRANALRLRGQGRRANKIDAVRNRPNMEESYVEIDERLAHKFPLSPEEEQMVKNIKKAAEEKAKQRSNQSTTKSARKRKKLEYEVRESYDFYDIVLEHLLDEGYCDTEEKAITMMASMSEEWIDSIISEAPFQISGPHPTTIDGTKLEYSPSNVGKPYKNKKRAKTRANKLNQDHGANVYRVTEVD